MKYRDIEGSEEFAQKLIQGGYKPITDPDRVLNIEALLPCAFARSVKMMRFIDSVYDEDKDRFYQAAQKSSRRNSRLISANRIKIRLNAMKAQGVYMASLEDEELAAKLLDHAERAFNRLSSAIKSYEHFPVSFGQIYNQFVDKMGNSDNGLHDFTGLFIYFSRSYNQEIIKDDTSWQSTLLVVGGKEENQLKPYTEVMQDMIAGGKPEARQMQENLAKNLPRAVPGKTFAEMWALPPGQKECNFYQMLWDLSVLDGYDLSMFENEKFSTKELHEITDVITIRGCQMQTTPEDLCIYYIIGVLLRSIFRAYREATDMIDEYSGIVRESDKNKKLASMAARQNSRILELEKLNIEKQEKLNESQMEIDRLKKQLAEQEKQLQYDKERIAILEQVAAEEEAYGHDDAVVREDSAEYATGTERARSANVIVFGGPPNWQNQVKSKAPNYVCVSVDSNTIDKKKIQKADAIVIKTDYLSHKQWHQVVDQAKKFGRKIVYCRNNISLLFMQVEKVLI